MADEDFGVEVGTAYVSVIPSLKGFGKALQTELKREFADVDFDKLVTEAMAKRPIKVPLEPKFDTAKLSEQLAKSRAKLKVKVDVDKDAAGGLFAGLESLTKGLPGIGRLVSALGDVIGAVQKVGSSSTQAGGAVAGAFSTMAGPVGALAAALVAAGAAFALLNTGVALAVPLLGGVAAGLAAAAGAAAAIPGALAGAGAAFATLAIGLQGISDAFKPKAGGGGGGGEDLASRARRIAGAERGIEAARRGIAAANRALQSSERGLAAALENVTKANERLKLSQQAVNAARREALEDLDELNRRVTGAQLDEVEASQAVEDALRELNAVKLTGILPDIARANNAYQRALFNLEEAKDASKDLGREQADAARKGVEGSDKVQDALRDQVAAFDAVKDAQRGVISAQEAVLSANDGLKSSYDSLASANDALAEAQKKTASGGVAAAAQMIPLAKNARKFVDAVKALKPAFESLRLDVQNRLFAGLDRTVTQMWRAWDKQLHITLGSFADTFNTFARNLGAAISTPKFISDMATAAEAVRRGMERIGEAVTSKLVPALGTLAEKSGPFLEKFADLIADAVEDFGTWIEDANRTGKLASFFDKAVEALEDIWETGRQVVRLIGNLFGIVFRGNGKDDKSAVDSLNEGLDKLNDWLENPANINAIAAFLDSWKRQFDEFVGKFNFAQKLLGNGDQTKQAGDAGKQIGDAIVAGLITGLLSLNELSYKIVEYLLFDSPFSLIGGFKRLLGIKSPSTVMATIGVQVIQGLIQGIGGMLSSLLRTAALIPSAIIRGIGNIARSAFNIGNGVANNLITSISSAIGSLYNIGRDIVGGLWRGIRSLGGWLRDNILAFAKWAIPDALEKFFGIASPSKLMADLGKHLPEGLAVGIEDGTVLVSNATQGMADAAVPALVPGLVSAPGYRAGAVTPMSGELTFRKGATGDPIIDAIREFIAFRFGGDPDAAFAS